MKIKLWIIFLFILILPLILLLGIGIKWRQDEQKILRSQYQDLLLNQLQNIQSQIALFIKGEEKKIFELLSSAENEAVDKLREIIRKSPLIFQIFKVNSKGEYLHPFSASKDLSEKEKQFLIRSKQRLYTNLIQSDANSNEIFSSQIKEDNKGLWTSYFWNNQMYLIYYITMKDEIKIGAELDWENFLSRLLGIFPDSSNLFIRNKFCVILKDFTGRILYQWGNQKAQGIPLVQISLSTPLNPLTLEYYGEFRHSEKSFIFNFFSGMFLLFMTVFGLATVFYRENTKAMRDAQNKVSFVNLVSHELKTPLTNIQMYAELIQQNLDGDDEKAMHYLKVLVSESQRLSRLITNVLTFSKKEKHQLKIRRHSGKIKEVILRTLEQSRLSLEEKGIIIEFISDDDAQVELDQDCVQQILGNLIANVEKYALSGRWLGIFHKREGDMTIIRVSDKGPGIPKDKREKVFEPFYRISNQLNDGVAGTGIGLTIARELACLHGGTLFLIDTPLGSIFEIRLLTPLRNNCE